MKSTLRKTRNAKRQSRRAVFSNQANVRNLYENVNPNTGNVTTHLNEYKVPIDNEYEENPVLVLKKGQMVSKKPIIPKSSLTRAMHLMGANSGLAKPLNSFTELTRSKIDNAQRNFSIMESKFGNNWVNATVENEELTVEYNKAINSINRDYEIQTTLLKNNLLENTGINIDNMSGQQEEEDLEDAYTSGRINASTYFRRVNRLHAVPEEHKVKYANFKAKLQELLNVRDSYISEVTHVYNIAVAS